MEESSRAKSCTAISFTDKAKPLWPQNNKDSINLQAEAGQSMGWWKYPFPCSLNLGNNEGWPSTLNHLCENGQMIYSLWHKTVKISLSRTMSLHSTHAQWSQAGPNTGSINLFFYWRHWCTFIHRNQLKLTFMASVVCVFIWCVCEWGLGLEFQHLPAHT